MDVIGIGIGILLTLLAVQAAIFQFLWNSSVSNIFGLDKIRFIQAFCLLGLIWLVVLPIIIINSNALNL